MDSCALPPDSAPAPADGSVERWCWDLITSESLAHKLAPPAMRIGVTHHWEPDACPRRLSRPGRPGELEVVQRSPRSPRPGAIQAPAARAQLLHTFLHHELQAAELFGWAVLAFPGSPTRFRAGLIAILREELRHAGLYATRLGELGFAFGDFAVRDWFWSRVPEVRDALGFVSLMGLGLEAANLDHSASFARRFRSVGDLRSAERIEEVERDEVRHVAFALRWFRRFSGGFDFTGWLAQLPAPLSPALFQGRSLNVAARRRAGLEGAFLEELRSWAGRTSSGGERPV